MKFSRPCKKIRRYFLNRLIIPFSVFSLFFFPTDLIQSSHILYHQAKNNHWDNSPTFFSEGDTPPDAYPNDASFPRPTAEKSSLNPDDSLIEYTVRSGDTLQALASHFDVAVEDIQSHVRLDHQGFLTPGQSLLIPDRVETDCSDSELLPDSEMVYSQNAIDFNIENFLSKTDGYLSTYQEALPQGEETASGIIYRVAINQSINPRLLIALLQHQSNWVYGKPLEQNDEDYPIGWISPDEKGLYEQLRWTAGQLNYGYYGWRDGSLTQLTFTDGSSLRLAPDVNAGTVAIQYFFSKLMTREEWENALYGDENIMDLYEHMFDAPWSRAKKSEPLLSQDVIQPEMELPIEEGTFWNLTGGPHAAYGSLDAIAALDFAPVGRQSCSKSFEWVTASAGGLVVRSDENSIVVIDLDGDGYEQTGWVLFYVHMASIDRVAVGTYVQTNDKIGHPSCEGGLASGAHIHIARKYNGEWMAADGPVPMILSGWQAFAGEKKYKGYMIKNEKIVVASDVGSAESLITH